MSIDSVNESVRSVDFQKYKFFIIATKPISFIKHRSKSRISLNRVLLGFFDVNLRFDVELND